VGYVLRGISSLSYKVKGGHTFRRTSPNRLLVYPHQTSQNVSTLIVSRTRPINLVTFHSPEGCLRGER
jgi:hypothetical protein